MITHAQAKRIAESYGYTLSFNSVDGEYRARPISARWNDAKCIYASTVEECLDTVRMDAKRSYDAFCILRDCANQLRAIATHPSANDADKALAAMIGELLI